MDRIEDVLLLLSSCRFSPIIEINPLQIEADTVRFDQNILAVHVQVVFPERVDLLQSAGEAVQHVLGKVRLQSLARVTRDPPLQGLSLAKIRDQCNHAISVDRDHLRMMALKDDGAVAQRVQFLRVFYRASTLGIAMGKIKLRGPEDSRIQFTDLVGLVFITAA